MMKERVGSFWVLRAVLFYHMCPKCDSQVRYVGNFGEDETAAIDFTCGFRVFCPSGSYCVYFEVLFQSLIFPP